MPNIKFSHTYSKLYHNSTLCNAAQLLQVIPVDLIDITQEMRDYDTDNGTYPLPQKGAYLMLIFKKATGSIFTTIRRDTPEKKEYYMSKVGEVFEIHVEK